jgi:hypothetical protein
MYTLEAARLKLGDIIFTRDKGAATSWGIRAGSLARYSHAMLYVEDHSYIDSDPNGVHANNLQRLLRGAANDIAVKRLKEPLPPEAILAACNFARSQVGKRYSVLGAAGTFQGIRRAKLTSVNRQFCSRLVAMAYASIGCALVKNPLFSSPRRVFVSPNLTLVEDAHRVASAAEVAFATNTEPNLLTRQEDATNKLFENVRRETGSDVDTFEELVNLVTESPETDAPVSAILRESEYFFLWREIPGRHSMWFNTEVYAERVPINEQAELAASQYLSVLNSLDRRKETITSLLGRFSQTGSSTVALLLTLEQALLEQDRERLAVLEHFLTL